MRQVFANIKTILAEVDRELDDVVKDASYIVDISEHYDAFHSVYRGIFQPEPFPCHTAPGVERLASETPRVELEVEVPIGKEVR